jgi:uncharacterized protein
MRPGTNFRAVQPRFVQVPIHAIVMSETADPSPADLPGGALGRLMVALGPDPARRAVPPVEKWNPDFCGDIDLRIAADGSWHYMGSPITRPALMRLFASILRKDPERYVLVTPVERVGITVDDLPFAAVEMAVEGTGDGRQIAFRTSVDDLVAVSMDHPLRFDQDGLGGIRPAVRVRADLWARVTRALTFDLVELAEERVVAGRRVLGVGAGGCFFAIAPVEEADAAR